MFVGKLIYNDAGVTADITELYSECWCNYNAINVKLYTKMTVCRCNLKRH